MTRKLFSAVALMFIMMGSLTWSSHVAQAKTLDNDVLTISRIRVLPLGTLVTVAGTVSTPSGAFESSFFDQGFGLQDDSAGIYVSTQDNLSAKPGQSARVTGVLQDSYGLLILVPAASTDVVISGRGEPVHSLFVPTSNVGERTEGSIVQVVGHVSQPITADLPYGYKFAVDDGSGPIQIFINQQTSIDPTSLALGETVSITGFSSQFETHYEIDPRSPKDIKVRKH